LSVIFPISPPLVLQIPLLAATAGVVLVLYGTVEDIQTLLSHSLNISEHVIGDVYSVG
jgi:hypothetical protein